MRVSRIAYYCSYTRDIDDPPRMTEAFRTEAAACAEAKKIRQQGFWGAVVKYVECKEDYQSNSAWLPDWTRVGERAVQLVEYF
jgi:hypothetical protein